MATGNSTQGAQTPALSPEALHEIRADANEVELTFHAIREIVGVITNMTTTIDPHQDERSALLLAISQMALVGVGTAGAIARSTGGQEFGMLTENLRKLVGGE